MKTALLFYHSSDEMLEHFLDFHEIETDQANNVSEINVFIFYYFNINT